MTVDPLICIVVGMVYLYFVGHSFIDSFFKQKADMINQLINNEKGEG